MIAAMRKKCVTLKPSAIRGLRSSAASASACSARSSSLKYVHHSAVSCVTVKTNVRSKNSSSEVARRLRVVSVASTAAP
jgi:hypothetical protein